MKDKTPKPTALTRDKSHKTPIHPQILLDKTLRLPPQNHDTI